VILATKYTGAEFFGYEYSENGMIVQCPEEQWTLRAIRSLRADGMSFRRIEAELASRGVQYFGLSGGRGFPTWQILGALRQEEKARTGRKAIGARRKKGATSGK
jgi:hypothetical protein